MEGRQENTQRLRQDKHTFGPRAYPRPRARSLKEGEVEKHPSYLTTASLRADLAPTSSSPTSKNRSHMLNFFEIRVFY